MKTHGARKGAGQQARCTGTKRVPYVPDDVEQRLRPERLGEEGEVRRRLRLMPDYPLAVAADQDELHGWSRCVQLGPKLDPGQAPRVALGCRQRAIVGGTVNHLRLAPSYRSARPDAVSLTAVSP